MKTNKMRVLLAISMLLFAAITVFTSCKKDSDDPVAVIEDGLYIKGAGTALTDFDSKGLFKITRNEVTQTNRDSLVEIYIAVKAGAEGFNIVNVIGGVPVVYGPGADFAAVDSAARDIEEPKVDFQRGSYVVSSTPFTVPKDGLYHVVLDKELKKVAVLPVVWGVIGAATPGGWSNSTALPSQGFDLNTITFQITDMVMTKADFKFRYSGGWKVILDKDFDLGGGQKGIKVNCNFGGAVDALVPGGGNIANATPGKYTAKMVWTLGAGHTATLTKTGDLDLIDYTDTELGLVGNGIIVADTASGWGLTIMLSKPTIENLTTYIWTYSGVQLSTLGSFKIREGQDWSKKSIGYNDVTMAGLSADKFETNGDGNFVPLEDGTYDMELKIDAVTETYTLTVNPAGAAPALYMLGDGCTAGWDNTAPLQLSGTAGVYTITTALQGTGKFIKFLTTIGQWAPQYGTDAAGTSTGGNLVYRPTETDPDPPAIPVPDAVGTYIVSVNLNTLTYTITAK